ncbi:MAG: ketopantoate reductase family protein, partial [Thermoplasmata archaeon]
AGTFLLEALDSIGSAHAPDAVVLATKTFDLRRGATELGERFPRLVPTLLPQNGLDVEEVASEPLRSASGKDPIPVLVRAVNTIPATLVAPGVVRQAGDGEIVLRDPARPTPSSAATTVFRDAFHRAGVPVRLVPDLERELWRKALVNAAINPVTALHGVPNGRLRETPYREESRVLLREAQRAAEASGFRFSDSEADADLDRVVRASAQNRSSMLQDRERGRPTEIDAISGALLRAASAHGIDLPATRAVVARLTTVPGDRVDRTQPS